MNLRFLDADDISRAIAISCIGMILISSFGVLSHGLDIDETDKDKATEKVLTEQDIEPERWVFDKVDGEGSVGKYTSIDLD
ncbi:MAG: hypothetical protein KGY76_08405, partial [Candidatus Thermoplasmatota archaeon]|nr:hypothetical protein [Candidatus Thermoplasmatota archaeon]